MRWLPGTRILTCMVAAEEAKAGVSVAAHGMPGATRNRCSEFSGGSDCSGSGAETELVEPQAQLFDRAVEDCRDHAKIVAANGEHLAVEGLALKLDGARESGQDRGIGVAGAA